MAWVGYWLRDIVSAPSMRDLEGFRAEELQASTGADLSEQHHPASTSGRSPFHSIAAASPAFPGSPTKASRRSLSSHPVAVAVLRGFSGMMLDPAYSLEAPLTRKVPDDLLSAADSFTAARGQKNSASLSSTPSKLQITSYPAVTDRKLASPPNSSVVGSRASSHTSGDDSDLLSPGSDMTPLTSRDNSSTSYRPAHAVMSSAKTAAAAPGAAVWSSQEVGQLLHEDGKEGEGEEPAQSLHQGRFYTLRVLSRKGHLASAHVEATFQASPKEILELLAYPNVAAWSRGVKEMGSWAVVAPPEGHRRSTRVFQMDQVGELAILWLRHRYGLSIRVTEDETNPEELEMTFELIESSLLHRFCGHWRLHPVAAVGKDGCPTVHTKAFLQQDVLPKGCHPVLKRLPLVGSMLSGTVVGPLQRLMEDMDSVISEMQKSGRSMNEVLVKREAAFVAANPRIPVLRPVMNLP